MKSTLSSSAFSKNYSNSSYLNRFSNTAGVGVLRKDKIADKEWLKEKGVFTLENK